MTSIPCTITPESINVFFEGRMRSIPKGHMNFDKVGKLLKDVDKLASASPARFSGITSMIYGSKQERIDRAITKLRILLDIPAYLTKLTEGMVKVTDKGVLFGDNPIHSVLADRIMDHLQRGLDVLPLAKFMNKVMANPKADIAAELYEWMEAAKLPLTAEGNLIAFKKVANDYTSIHTGPDGKIFNTIGAVVKMDRDKVDHDRTVTCSTGLHFCGYDYLGNYGWGGENRVVVIEISPTDVCAIPTDYSFQKGRGCEYKVIGEVSQDEAQNFCSGSPLITGGTVGHAAFQTPDTTAEYDVFEEEYGDDPWLNDHENYGDPYNTSFLVESPPTQQFTPAEQAVSDVAHLTEEEYEQSIEDIRAKMGWDPDLDPMIISTDPVLDARKKAYVGARKIDIADLAYNPDDFKAWQAAGEPLNWPIADDTPPTDEEIAIARQVISDGDYPEVVRDALLQLVDKVENTYKARETTKATIDYDPVADPFADDNPFPETAINAAVQPAPFRSDDPGAEWYDEKNNHDSSNDDDGWGFTGHGDNPDETSDYESEQGAVERKIADDLEDERLVSFREENVRLALAIENYKTANEYLKKSAAEQEANNQEDIRVNQEHIDKLVREYENGPDDDNKMDGF